MRIPSHPDAFEVLCLQAASDGRGELLLGDSLQRARTCGRPFMVGERFPDVYYEFPLAGDPFLDITVLYGSLPKGVRVASDAAAGTGPLFDWFAEARAQHARICFGFELDTSKEELPRAAVHFQPREHVELVAPFFDVLGEPERGKLYLDLAERMPEGWQLSFFGLFRGRKDSPLRVCGYLGQQEADASGDPRHLADIFDAIGFTAYDDTMLAQVSQVMGLSGVGLDFQLDVYPDGTLGDTFALDLQFAIEQPRAVRESFEHGLVGRLMRQFEQWGIVDDRWHRASGTAFARSLPVEDDSGACGRFAFMLMPRWIKVRWRNAVLQPAKLYCLGSTQLLGLDGQQDGARASEGEAEG